MLYPLIYRPPQALLTAGPPQLLHAGLLALALDSGKISSALENQLSFIFVPLKLK